MIEKEKKKIKLEYKNKIMWYRMFSRDGEKIRYRFRYATSIGIYPRG